MQKGSTFAVAWAVLASACALPHAARADSSLTPYQSVTSPIDANQLGLVDGRFYVFDFTKQVPLPGQQKVSVDLMSIGSKMGNVYLKGETNNLFSFKGINFSANAAGTWQTLTNGEIEGLNVGLLASTKIAGGDASLNLSSSLAGIEEGRFNAALSWSKPLEGGSSLSFTANGRYDDNAAEQVAGETWLRLNINLHPDAPAAATQPFNQDLNQWERNVSPTQNSTMWGLDSWESR